MVVIDGIIYDVAIEDLGQSADVIDKFAERTESGELQHEVLGVYHNFEVVFEPIRNPAVHEAFYSALTAAKDKWTVTLPGTFTTYTFDCYIRVKPVKIIRHKTTGNTYEGLEVSFIAISPRRRR